MSAQWTTPYCGVQHLGARSLTGFWASVCDYDTFAVSKLWTPGCQFSPREQRHDTVQEARAYAERQLQDLAQR